MKALNIVTREKKTFYISIDIQKYSLLGSLRHPIDNDSPSVSLSAKR